MVTTSSSIGWHITQDAQLVAFRSPRVAVGGILFGLARILVYGTDGQLYAAGKTVDQPAD
jgi:hypothetical protein